MAPVPVLQSPAPMMPGMTPVVQASMLDTKTVAIVSVGASFSVALTIWIIRRIIAWKIASARRKG
ncbi:hypothetical protein ACHAPU_000268 [Fusarium lateritium]